jgi:GcrA cell cycle regulator
MSEPTAQAHFRATGKAPKSTVVQLLDGTINRSKRQSEERKSLNPSAHLEGWTEDRIATLKRMWAEGSSATEIAAALGGGVTRSGVLGKIRRLRVPARALPATHGRGRGNPGQARSNAIVARSTRKASKPLKAVPNVADEAMFAGEADAGVDVTHLVGLVSLIDLNDHVCRWPFGDPLVKPFGFCGVEKTGPGPYCEAHASKAFLLRSASK